MATLETTLIHPGPGKPRFYHLTLDGGQLISRAWTGTNSGRRTVRDLGNLDEGSAINTFAKLRDGKMREGFCYRADVETASRGDVVLGFIGLDNGPGDAFDLSPDGRSLVFGRMLYMVRGAEIFVMDIATGHRRLVHTIPSHGGDRTYLTAVLFHADGRRIIYVVNGRTVLLDPDTGQEEVLAAHTELDSPSFDKHHLHPTWSRDRRRLLLFDSGNRMRIVDKELSTVAEIAVPKSGFTCQTSALSPSGRLLALSRESDIEEDEPTVTQLTVWEVDTGTVVRRFPVGRPVHREWIPRKRLCFDPAERIVIAGPASANGLDAFDIETGKPVWRLPDPGGLTNPWDYCYVCDYSPDGTDLVIGRRGELEVVDTETREPDPAFGRHWPQSGGTGNTIGVQVSTDGTLLATAGGGSGRIVVYRL